MRARWPGRSRIDQGQAARLRSLVAILLLAVGGCAQRDGAEAATTLTTPATVTVGPGDDGRTVDLTVGDRLIVELPTATQPSRFPSAWTLGSLPPKVLKRVQGDSSATRVVFVAQAPGTVRLFLVRRQDCGPPLRCPLASPSGPSTKVRPPLPPAVVTITVRVQ
jgi:hypothetical protein